MKVDFQQENENAQIGSCLTAASSLTTTATTTQPSISCCTTDHGDDKKSDSNNNNTSIISIVPFERHRQDEVVTLFQNGLLAYDFNDNNTWKRLNEWFVTDRLNKEMKDVYTGFNMTTASPAKQAETSCQTNHDSDENDTSLFEGLHFFTAIDTLTDKAVGCVGIKRPDQHTLNLLMLRHQQSTTEQRGSHVAISKETTCELVRLSVDASYRRRGIGQKLVHAVELYAKQNDYHHVCLTTLQVQTQAVALYENCGYSIVAVEDIGIPQEQELGNNQTMSLVYLCKQLD